MTESVQPPIKQEDEKNDLVELEKKIQDIIAEIDITAEELDDLDPEEMCTHVRKVGNLLGACDSSLISSEVERQTLEIALRQLPLIMDRFIGMPEEKRQKARAENVELTWDHTQQVHELGELLGRMIRYLDWADARVPPPMIVKYYEQMLHSPDRVVRFASYNMLDSIVAFDYRNKKAGEESCGGFDKCKQELFDAIDRADAVSREIAQQIVDSFWAHARPESLIPIYLEAIARVTTREDAQYVYRLFSNRLPEGEKTALKLLFDPTQDEKFRKQARFVLQVLGHLPEKAEKMVDAGQLYDAFDIDHWQPNEELIEVENTLLKKELKPGSVVLDLGLGTGRHMQKLKDTGVHAFGIDLNPNNVLKAKQKDPSLNAIPASWFKIPFLPQSFDAAYCLGRSFPHNFTMVEMTEFFREVFKTLKPDGTLLIDLPDANKAHVRDQIARHEALAEEQRIEFSEPGIHIGSPDGKNFTLRFIPDDEQLCAIARMAGFTGEKILSQDYVDQSGQNNTNYYWKFTKTDVPIPADDLLELIHNAHTASAPTEFVRLGL